MPQSLDSFSTRTDLSAGGETLAYYSLPKLQEKSGIDVGRLPYCLKVLLENLLRNEDGKAVTKDDIERLASWEPKKKPDTEIAFTPARVVLQDFTGVPAVVDLAALRDAMADLGGDPSKINPLCPSELVIDHSVQVDAFGSADALRINAEKDYGRNGERYALLRWGQTAFRNFKVVPPATGIVHQVNLEYLARVVFAEGGVAYPDTVVGTDSHTTMINGIGVLGWGVGGIEAEAAMLGQPINLLVPQVVGFRLDGKLPEGATATDLVLTITKMLRDEGVVGKFVEFFGEGLDHLTLADRATLGNMSPEFGCTSAISPVDAETIRYVKFTGRSDAQAERIERYARAQGMFHTKDTRDPEYSATLELDLSTVQPTLAGPKRPHDKVLLSDIKQSWSKTLDQILDATGQGSDAKDATAEATLDGEPMTIGHGSVVIAAITSCTNTSNPSVLVAAGLVARKAAQLGLRAKPWVKTSLAPGSKVVTRYLEKSGLMKDLEKLGFHVVGYGCTTCIGNSGPLPEPISRAIADAGLAAVSVLSGNRNFEGRISPDVRGNYLASPPLVVAYALAGRIDVDWEKEPVGQARDGEDVFLRDLWPSPREIQETIHASLSSDMYSDEYSNVFDGDDQWKSLPVPEGDRFGWDQDSTYVRRPTFFEGLSPDPAPLGDIEGARVLVLLGDTVTTDHISPAGSIAEDSPAGRYLKEHGVQKNDFNSYGSRRGNHEVMVRGTFANIRLRNQLAPGTEGGWTVHLPDGEQTSIYEASVRYQKDGVPLLVIAGKEYGSGSSRDWAAKGTDMLGIRAVIAEGYERIHRSNLIGMGVLPLQFADGEGKQALGLTGKEIYAIRGIADLKPGATLNVAAEADDGKKIEFSVKARIDTAVELDYYENGGILQYVLRQLVRG